MSASGAGRATTAHDEWVAVLTRAQADDRLSGRASQPRTDLCRRAICRALGVGNDTAPLTPVAIDDPRTADELASAYLAEYRRLVKEPDGGAQP